MVSLSLVQPSQVFGPEQYGTDIPHITQHAHLSYYMQPFDLAHAVSHRNTEYAQHPQPILRGRDEAFEGLTYQSPSQLSMHRDQACVITLAIIKLSRCLRVRFVLEADGMGLGVW